ncbi:hypothetical protein [Pseudomonas sp. SWRI154]|uniref:hypothetical protein n=1 Tax=Pseudomonas sp. SWRI154 TaxID=2745501 RepID=UPI001647EBA4|nr:hypothetical protein [Pseudomonas sp. SWRI154]MBC3363967.1 hypothetical protein [Pseudomonas sp. SWRI154]
MSTDGDTENKPSEHDEGIDDADGADLTFSEMADSGEILLRKESENVWAELRVRYSWSSSGDSFTVTTLNYKALNNPIRVGELHLKVTSPSANPNWEPLTMQARQDGNSHSVSHTKTIPANATSATIYFSFVFKTITNNINLEDSRTLTFIPVPTIDPIRNVLTRNFEITGGGRVTNGSVIVRTYLPAEADYGVWHPVPDNRWNTTLSIPSNLGKMYFTAYQRVGTVSSSHSAQSRVYVAEVTAPSAGSVVLSDAEFSGGAAPGTRVKMVRSHSANVEVTGYYDVPANAEWKLKLDPPLRSGKYLLTVWLRLTNFPDSYTPDLEYEVLGVPVITEPAAGSIPSNPFELWGNNGLSGATTRVYLSDDHTRDPKGLGWAFDDGTWFVRVDKPLPFGRVSLVVEQEKGGKQSGNSVLRQFIFPPNVPTIQSETNNGVVRLHGTGLAGARLDIHFRNNTTPYLNTNVAQDGTWGEVIPATLVPGSYWFTAQQSVPDGSGRIYSGYATNLPVEVPVPRPTGFSIRLTGQKPIFSGRGLRWVGYETDVRIYNVVAPIDGVADARVETDLQWQTASTNDFPPGHYTKLRAQQVVNSKTSAYTDDYEIKIPSPEPELSEPKANPEYTTQLPLFEGTAWRGSTVELTFTGGPAPISLTAPAGTFRHQVVNEDWAPGDYTVTVTASFGNEPASTVRNFRVRTPKPTITTSGSVDLAPRIEGTGWPSGWVVIHRGDGTVLGEGPVDAVSGKFSVSLSQQSQGTLVVYAIQALAQGSTNISEETARVSLTVGVRAPVILEPSDKTTRTSIFSGTGTTGGTVEFYLNDATDPFVHGVPVEEGEWWTTLELPAGNPKLEVALRHYGVLSVKQRHAIKVVPAPPIVDTPWPGEAVGDVLHISGFGFPTDEIRIYRLRELKLLGSATVTAAGTWTTSVENLLDAAGDKIVVVASAGEGLDSDRSGELQPTQLLKVLPHFTEPLPNDRVGLKPWYAGIATPNATIRVASWFNTEESLAPSTVADQFGRWQVMGNENLPEGPTRVAVRQTVNSVHSQWVESGRFIVEKMPAQFRPPTVDYPRMGQEVGRYPMFSGRGEPGAYVRITKEGHGSIYLVNDCWVDRNGTWAAQSMMELPLGDYRCATRQTRDGETSGWLTPNRAVKVIQVQAGFPAAVIHTPTNGATNVERRPLFAGTGTPGALLNIFSRSEEDRYRKYGETQVDAQGRWSMRSDVQLDLQSHAISCIQELDGQESLKPSTVNFTVIDVIDRPVVISPADEGDVSPQAVIRGTAMPGATIRLATRGDSSILWGSGIADDQGHWVIVTRPLLLGSFQMAAGTVQTSGTVAWVNFKFTVRDM